MAGAITAAEKILAAHPDYFMPQQFRNPANPDMHRRTTAKEILAVIGTRLDALVVGIGTGGTITGTGEVLKKEIAGLKVFAVEPAESPVFFRWQTRTASHSGNWRGLYSTGLQSKRCRPYSHRPL